VTAGAGQKLGETRLDLVKKMLVYLSPSSKRCTDVKIGVFISENNQDKDN